MAGGRGLATPKVRGLAQLSETPVCYFVGLGWKILPRNVSNLG